MSQLVAKICSRHSQYQIQKRGIILDIHHLAKLRCVVGKLGEKQTHGWWQCDFFSTSGSQFISPVFPRTGLLAKCQGLTVAAARVHDQRIGVGKVFHLYRLPEEVELEMHKLLQDPSFAAEIEPHLSTPESTLGALSTNTSKIDEGPVIAGELTDMDKSKCWKTVESMYRFGFDNNIKVFPYFASQTG